MEGGPGGGGEKASGLKQIIPGVSMVGTGDVKKLLADARANGIDVLAVFDVTVAHSTRSGITTNDNLLRVYNVRTGDMIVSSSNARAQTPKLNNVKTEIAREDEKKKDPVVLALDNLFNNVLDSTVSLQPMPTGLSPAGVLNRARVLLAKPTSEPLPALHEMAYYHGRQLMSKDHLTIGFQKLLGAQRGSILANGTPAQRQQLLATMLPNPPKLASAAAPAAAASRPPQGGVPNRGPVPGVNPPGGNPAPAVSPAAAPVGGNGGGQPQASPSSAGAAPSPADFNSSGAGVSNPGASPLPGANR